MVNMREPQVDEVDRFMGLENRNYSQPGYFQLASLKDASGSFDNEYEEGLEGAVYSHIGDRLEDDVDLTDDDKFLLCGAAQLWLEEKGSIRGRELSRMADHLRVMDWESYNEGTKRSVREKMAETMESYEFDMDFTDESIDSVDIYSPTRSSRR